MVRFRPSVYTNSGGRTGFVRHIVRLDTPSGPDLGWVGPFLKHNQQTELPVGSVVLEVIPRGSVNNGWQQAIVSSLSPNGSFDEISDPDQPLDWVLDRYSVRDAVRDGLDRTPNAWWHPRSSTPTNKHGPHGGYRTRCSCQKPSDAVF